MKALNCTPYELLVPDVIKSDGCYLFDSSGKRYVDMESGVWCLPLGHSHACVNQAISEQLAAVSHVGYRYSCDVVERAASEVLDVVGMGDGSCVFLSSGSEAVEFAVQTGKKLSDESKPLVLHLDNYFLSSYGQSASQPSDEWVSVAVPQNGDQSWEQELDRLPFEKIGVFVLEPGNASGLVRLPPKEFIAQIVKRVQAHGGLIVVDEVTTGFGRTGKWFGFEHYDISPDIVACGKGLGNGYPVSCVVMRGELAEQLRNTGFRYAQSHQNDPLGCAVATAVIAQIRADGLIEYAATIGSYLINRLTILAEANDLITEVRGIGLMLAIELSPHASVERIYRNLFERGYFVGLNIQKRVLRLYPPLIIDLKTVDEFLSIFEAAVANHGCAVGSTSVKDVV